MEQKKPDEKARRCNDDNPGHPAAGVEATRTLRLVIAGGGTGGHLFPGIAIAQEFMSRNPKNSVLFISTANALEKSVLAKTGYTLKKVTAEGIKGRGIFDQVLALMKIPFGIYESIREMKHYRPDIVLGVGSYSAGSVVIGAWLLGIKIALHEQNILPGITNRLLSGFADRIFVSFKNTRFRFHRQKVCISGNPVRKEILALTQKQPIADTTDFAKSRKFRILILGGSQGAHRINLAVTEALLHLKEKHRYFFVHQAGIHDETEVKRAYQKEGVGASVSTFFDDMAFQYRQADLIVCRAGATTVAEIAVAGKGVIFVPFPFAADNHQELNARELSDLGAAEILLEKDLDGKVLAERIEYYAARPEALAQMSSRAHAFGKPDAARIVVDACYKLALQAD